MSAATAPRGSSRRRSALVSLLAVAVFASSFGVVVTRHHVRMEFIHSENLRKERDALGTRWESLQLEHGALRSEARVEAVAKDALGMSTPERSETIVPSGGAE